MSKHIVIVGAGYGGLLSALSARAHLTAADAQITVINRIATHQIVTELHRLAAGNVADQAVALPLNKLLSNKDIHVKIGTVQQIDPVARKVVLEDGSMLSYDALVLALGSESNYFGIPGLQENSLSLKSVADAHRINTHIHERISEYARTKNKADATFIIGGGGLTGVEVIGELVDELPGICRKYNVDYADVSLFLVEAGPAILKGFPAELVQRATESLEKRGVQLLTGLAVTEVNGATVSLKDGRRIDANTLIWTGGVKGHPLVADCGVEVNRGRAVLNPFLQSVSHPDVFVAGDCGIVMGPQGNPLPESAQLAWQMGEQAGANIAAYFKATRMKEFHYVFSGTLASLGRKDAVGFIGETGIELKGLPATMMKKASDVRYLTHINGLTSLAYF
ncbi:NAD(P)/FAD-dependent oxidoreductase [Paenibacillus sp. CF384]|uniref:NAD(P)/FAD-dependent oxidoreductase n=1 Tax=Paenibacillus sp. CF384 TaxID=1884382 RepID=UPI00089D9620|nr:NAD(P)/FAD-dependent oxidoreductase [Paenibacillus sp. CF384]SDW98683.1 NADH dehydrogenase [Paenibacillus sp. CF384]